MNENQNTTHKILQYTAKAVIGRKLIYTTYTKTTLINNLTFNFKKQEKEQQTKTKASRRNSKD